MSIACTQVRWELAGIGERWLPPLESLAFERGLISHFSMRITESAGLMEVRSVDLT